MKTLIELKNFCEKNNVRFEMNPIYSKEWTNPYDMEVHRTLLGYEFGMNNIAGRSGKSEWQWVWFETIGCFDEPKDDTQFFFRNRYSMVNGVNHTSVSEMLKAELTIERRS